jgi:uncharacterized protein YjbI with pentapeptide repeats
LKIVNRTQLLCAVIPGRMDFPDHSATFIVKGTFDLVPGGTARIAEEPLFPTGDEHYPDDDEMKGSCRYESDFAYFKPRADLLLVGKAHAPGGRRVGKLIVSFRVGETSRSLEVVGDPTEGGHFSESDLRYEHSYGGVKHAANPVGRGRGKQTTPTGESRKLEPTITDPDKLGPSSEPAGFGPLGRMWKARARKLGTYKKKWKKERWPWFAEDLDWTHFNAAPTPMQVEGYLRGDEDIALDNVHPEHVRYESRLPSLRIRCFVDVPGDAAPDVALREVAMNLDTLWIDTEAEQLVLVWRGWTETLSPDFDEFEHLLVASEDLAVAPLSIEHYRDELLAELEPEEFTPRPEPDFDALEEGRGDEAELDAANEQNRETLRAMGLDPDALPEPSEEDRLRDAAMLAELGVVEDEPEVPWTRERVEQAAADGESLAALDLKGLDLSGLDLSGADLKEALLAGANLEGADLTGADLTEASLPTANLMDAKLEGALLVNADLTGADASRADFSGAELGDASFEAAVLESAVLTGVQAEGCVFDGATLTNARLDGAELTGVGFSRCALDGAVFQGSVLVSANFNGAVAHGADLSGTVLTEAQLSEGADFSGAVFRGASAVETVWEQASCADADFSHACLDGADFTSAQLQRTNFFGVEMKFARFMGADLTDARLTRMNLFQGSLERARLDGADLDGSNLYGVDFLDVLVDDAHLGSANVKMTSLA